MSEDTVSERALARRGGTAAGPDGHTPSDDEPLHALVTHHVRQAGGDITSVKDDVTHTYGFGWITYAPDHPLPAQGWKLHISATTANAIDTLGRVVPVLARRAAAFKVTRRIQDLAWLNVGAGGSSQIGKFITVYPADDSRATRLAVELHNATVGFGGPHIPSDYRYGSDSAVWYRYGAFGSSYLQLANGQVIAAIRTPDGEFEPDRRGTAPQTPAWAANPFPASDPEAHPNPVVKTRYLLTGTVSMSFSSEVLAAVDLRESKACVVKRAPRKSVRSGPSEHRFATEACALTRLASLPGIPRLVDLFSDGAYDYLVLSNAGRTTLSDWMTEQHRGTLDLGTVLPKVRDVAQTLELMHAAGIVHGDVKPTNIALDGAGRAILLDFGTAVSLGGEAQEVVFTSGYVTRERIAGGDLTIADDIHGVGAVMYALATGAEPSFAPDPDDLLTRPPRLLNPALRGDLEKVIARALSAEDGSGYSTMRELADDLVGGDTMNAPPPFGDAPRTGRASEEWAAEAAGRVALSLKASAHASSDHGGVVWHEPHPVSKGAPMRDLQIGSAGIVLALADLHIGPCDVEVEELLRAAAHDLLKSRHLHGGPLPGLMVGEAGIGVAAIRAGRVLNDTSLISAGADRVASTATIPHRSPDFFNGTAGRLLAHLIAWDATGQDQHLRAAEMAGRALVRSAVSEGGVAYWAIPAGFEGLSGARNLGYAHGAAGIADVLLMLYEETEERPYRDCARRAASWITRHSVASPSGRVDWPVSPAEPPYWPLWCHGAAGIGQFLLRASRCSLIPEAEWLLSGAAYAAARGARMAPPVQCHGLAGNVEFLLDAYQSTRDDRYLSEARSLADVLAGWEGRTPDKAPFRSDTEGVVSPSYWIGYSGVAACLLRIAEPHRPRQLSRDGMLYLRESLTAQ